jgi:2-polyprenyl-3-methyl-5-hydroxy-6-metoxy-1,4-benzoquinol methylase
MDSSTAGKARYDQIAEWYVTWVGTFEHEAGLICDAGVGVMADRLDGQRWLDVACGSGRTSRELARRGATVVGVDLSEQLIAVARAENGAEPLAVTHKAADITALGDWWDGAPFDGAACEMAIMDIDDLGGTVAAVSTVVRSGGAFVVSLVHPCFPGDAAGLSSWPPDLGYAAEGYWSSAGHNPDGVRIRVGSSHRMLATYLNTFLGAGFVLEKAYEPPTGVPTWLVLAMRRS